MTLRSRPPATAHCRSRMAQSSPASPTNKLRRKRTTRSFARLPSSRASRPNQIERLLAASSVAGPPTNVQFMVKDSKKVCCDRRLGVRSVHRRQAGRRGAAQDLFLLSRARQGSRLRLHPLLALARATGDRPRVTQASEKRPRRRSICSRDRPAMMRSRARSRTGT